MAVPVLPWLFFLLLLAIAGTVVLYHLRRRTARKVLLVVALFLLGLVLVLLFRVLVHDAHLSGPAWALHFLLFSAVAYLFVRALKRLFHPELIDDRPVSWPPLGLVKNFLAEQLPGRKHVRVPAPVTIHTILLVVALCVLGLVLAMLVWALLFEPHVSVAGLVFLVLLVGAFGFLFVRMLTRVLHPAPPGSRTVSCPPIGRLKDLLAERLPPGESDRLAEHLEDCSACQLRVEGLTAGQQSWPDMARKLSDHPPAPEPALKKVMEKLKESETEDEVDEVVFCGDLPAGFLHPPEKPGQLGRLARYEVLEEIGRGGMGVVYKAFDPSLHRMVAIKVLAPQLATSGAARKRFLREAKAAAAVTHDHIVTIHSVEEANGLPYLVMQYVAGLSLQERIDKEGPLELAEILRIGMQTASALAAAHGHAIVHRDVKPANILLEGGQRVKITDFGLARAMDDASMTQSGYVAGSPLYMAPEQARGEALDSRADLFSLGSVLYTLCTGRPPFRAANTLAVLRRVCEDVPRPIRESNPAVPDSFSAVVEKLMAKEPADRFGSAAEVVEVLGRQLAQLQQAAWVPPAAGHADTAGLPSSVTICPSCGASLHVPDRMVGNVVHCAECGEPFHAEDGSEEILVARSVPGPFGKRSRTKKKLSSWFWGLGGCLALLFLLLLVRLSLTAHNPPAPVQPAKAAPFWKSTLGQFPEEATLFGAINLKAFGSVKIEDEWTQTMLRLTLPKEINKRLTPENLGRIRLDAISMAWFEESKPEKSRGMVQLEGLALDGRKRIIDFIRESSGDKVQVEEEVRGSGKPIRVTGPELTFALGLFDDQRVFLARSMKKGSTESDHREVLDQFPCFHNSKGSAKNLLAGYHPPWVKAALGEVPEDACALLLGEIPIEWRNHLKEALELRTCPRSFDFHLKRQGDGVALSLGLNVEKAGAVLTLLEDLETWSRDGLDNLRKRFPSLKKERQTLELLGQTIQSMQWQVESRSPIGSRCVRTRVEIPGRTWKALGKLVKRESQALE